MRLPQVKEKPGRYPGAVPAFYGVYDSLQVFSGSHILQFSTARFVFWAELVSSAEALAFCGDARYVFYVNQ